MLPPRFVQSVVASTLKDATLEVLHEGVSPLQHVPATPIIWDLTPSADDETHYVSSSPEDSDVLDTAFLQALDKNFPFLDAEVDP